MSFPYPPASCGSRTPRSRSECGAGSMAGAGAKAGGWGPGSEVTWVNTLHVELRLSQEGGAADSRGGGGCALRAQGGLGRRGARAAWLRLELRFLYPNAIMITVARAGPALGDGTTLHDNPTPCALSHFADEVKKLAPSHVAGKVAPPRSALGSQAPRGLFRGCVARGSGVRLLRSALSLGTVFGSVNMARPAAPCLVR